VVIQIASRAAKIPNLEPYLARFPRELSGDAAARGRAGHVRDPKVFPVRRTAVEPRCQAARGDARRDQRCTSG
jgi:hypothetical protein